MFLYVAMALTSHDTEFILSGGEGVTGGPTTWAAGLEEFQLDQNL